MKTCSRCNNGKIRYELKDAAGIFCSFVCEDCEQYVRNEYKPSIFEPGTRYAQSGEEDDIGYEEDYYDDEPEEQYADEDEDYIRFADPGGNSALRAASPTNPRNLPCPTCGEPNRLTPIDVSLHYQCDSCADKAERGWE